MDTAQLLGDEHRHLLLDHKATAFPKELLTLPGPDYLSEVFALTDRSPTVLRNYGHARASRTSGQHGVPLHPARRPRHRTLGGREFLSQSQLLRPRTSL
jgi:hypothetical protein